MADRFFEEQEQQTTENQPETVKLGDKEYSQEDLQALVGLGEIAREAEQKYKTKIDRVWPEYTKSRQQLSEYEKELQDLRTKTQQQPNQQPAQQTVQLTAEQRAQAIQQLDDLLKESKYLDERTRAISREERAAEQLISDIGVVVTNAETEGKPVANTEEVLNFMAETGIRNPQLAYEVMFRDDLKKIEEDKLLSLREKGMVTTSQSTAGAKNPNVQPPRTRNELLRAVQDALGGE